MSTRGGYHPDSRIQTLKDELWITALLMIGASSAEQPRRVGEIIRIAHKGAGILRGELGA